MTALAVSAPADQTSAVDALFEGDDAYYPLRRPRMVSERGTLGFKFRSRFLLTMFAAPLWSIPLWATLAVLSDPAWVIGWFGAWFLTVMTGICGETLVWGPFASSFAPAGVRKVWGKSDAPTYSDDELVVLEAIWTLREGIDELEAATEKLAAQRSAEDTRRRERFEEQARAALELGDERRGRSLLQAKIDADEHDAFLAAEIAGIRPQLDELKAREYHLRAQLAVYRMQHTSLKAQTSANQARARLVEQADKLSALGADVALDQSQLYAIREDALSAEARALALEELAGQTTLSAATLGRGSGTHSVQLDEQLERLKGEVALARV